MNDALTAMRDLIQQDPGRRGLATDPAVNLFTACADDFAAACHSIAATPQASVAVVTGLFIPTSQPPAGETDGPLGAVFLARALTPLGIRAALIADDFCLPALKAGLEDCGLDKQVPLLAIPALHPEQLLETFRPTHLMAVERVGPSHTPESLRLQLGDGEALAQFLQEVPQPDFDRCHTMRGTDVTDLMGPAHLLFEAAASEQITTIGIGDGGNEIGMGKIAWAVIRRNVPGGGKTACRVPTDYLIVAGISNWGAYAMAAGVWTARGQRPPAHLFDVERERYLLELMVRQGPLVDGVIGQQQATVDGLPFEQYIAPLARLAQFSV